MGFGLPSVLGAGIAFDRKNGREKRVVVDIDGDGSFLMNSQELAVAFTRNLDLKVFILNNEHLGMVIQWEDQFYNGNRGDSFLGKQGGAFHETKVEADVYPDFVKMAEAFGVQADRVIDPAKLRTAIRKMLDTPYPYLLDVMIPHVQQFYQ